jgi:hypothetical protein
VTLAADLIDLAAAWALSSEVVLHQFPLSRAGARPRTPQSAFSDLLVRGKTYMVTNGRSYQRLDCCLVMPRSESFIRGRSRALNATDPGQG